METICWDCKNYNKCAWSRGEPVEGWKAKPTKTDDGIRSYLVMECPEFVRDDKYRATREEIGRIIGRSNHTVSKWASTYEGAMKLKGELKEKGYKLFIYKSKTKRRYYLMRCEK